MRSRVRFTQEEPNPCGALEKIVDAEGNATWFFYDDQGRLLEKKYDDLKGLSYTYEPLSGRLSTMTDAKNQKTRYRYNADNTLASVAYLNATTGASLEREDELDPTLKIDAAVSFAYETWYRRVSSMTDGTGTTSYTYWPVGGPGAGRLATENGPLAGTVDQVTHTYDEYGRETGLAVGTGAEATTEGRAFDALGRVTAVNNGLGAFAYHYVGDTGRLAQVDYPNGLQTTYGYHPANAAAGTGNGDFRLAQIVNKGLGTIVLSRFDYGYDATGNITSWTQAQGGAGKAWVLGYDAADQLTSVTIPNPNTANGEAGQSNYSYDFAGNRTIEQRDSVTVGASFNALNQVTGRSGSVKKVVFSGTSDEVGPVTVGGVQAAVTPDGSGGSTWTAELALPNGPHTLPVEAKDAAGNGRHYEVKTTVSGAGTGATDGFTYDENGNLTSRTLNGVTTTYEWDAANRLVAVRYGYGGGFVFGYNGRGQRVRQIRVADIGGSPEYVDDRRLIWNGLELKAELSTVDTTRKATHYPQGSRLFDILSQSFVDCTYTRDHLGSVREVTDGSGTLQARFAYDAWGRRRWLAGSVNVPHGFTGHYYLGDGLQIAFYRTYDAELGRWLNRDPIGELGGTNVYGYLDTNPIGSVDPLGLTPELLFTALEDGTVWVSEQQEAISGHLSNVFSQNGKCYRKTAEEIIRYHYEDRMKHYYYADTDDDGGSLLSMIDFALSMIGLVTEGGVILDLAGAGIDTTGLAQQLKGKKKKRTIYDLKFKLRQRKRDGNHFYTNGAIEEIATCSCEATGISTGTSYTPQALP
jgi:RHS repeat-associated protein